MTLWFRRLAAAAAGLFVSIAVAEVALSFIPIDGHAWYRWDARVGHRLVPGHEGTVAEGGRRARINAAGFHDLERRMPRAPGAYRIAVLGDSFVEALQVPISASFVSIAGRRLGGCQPIAGRDIEVLNFGVGGYGTGEELITLRDQVWQYRPDLVLVAVYVGNDIADNSRALALADKPYFIADGNQLVHDGSFASRAGLRGTAIGEAFARLYERSRVLQLIQGVRRQWIARTGPRASPPGLAQAGGRFQPFAVLRELYREPTHQSWSDAWSVTELLLDAMRADAAAHDASFLVATLSTDVQVFPDPAFRAELHRELGVADLWYPNRRLVEIGRRRQLTVLDLGPDLASYADEHRVFLHGLPGGTPGAGHYNAEGHRVTGELLADRVCDALRSETRGTAT